MTESQALRIEKLLRLQTIQLQNLLTAIGALHVVVAPDTMHKVVIDTMNPMLATSKALVQSTLAQLNGDLYRENKQAADEMRAFQEALERDQGREPLGFKK